MEKHKLALTVQNRVISLKFSTHRVSKKCTLGNFQKIFLFPKMAAILNFRIFAKNRKTGICFYLLNKRLIGWTLHMIMCVLLCYPVSIHMSQLQATGRPISSSYFILLCFYPTGLKGCRGIVFTHCVWMSGRVGGRRGKSLSGLYLIKSNL